MPNRVKSIEKAIIILDLLSSQGEVGITELSKHLGVSKSSVFNVLYTLREHNWVEKNEVTGKYRLGLRMLELGSRVRARLKLREIAIPYMQEMIAKTNETTYLTVYNLGKVVYIETAYPDNLISMSSVIGRRVHLHCTGVGKAIMAFLSEKEIKTIVSNHGLPRFTANTITTMEELQSELNEIRNKGYAIDNMEHEHGIKCVAAPIFNENGQAFASMSLSGPSLRFENKTEVYAELIKQAALKISHKMGWEGKKTDNPL